MKKTMSLLLLILLILIPSCTNAFSVTVNPSEVKSGYKFDFSINVDQNVYLANGHITFDSTLFSFVKSNTPGLEVEKVSENEIAWIYTDLNDSPVGTKTLNFTFEPQDVIKNQSANFVTSESVYITLDENTYEGNEITQEVTILSKENLPLPSTGGIGRVIFIVLGITLMGVAIIILIKKNKKE